MRRRRRRWWWRWTKWPRTYDGGSYRIESRWKEEVVYWEGDRGVWFLAGWGARPPVLSVPSAARWDDVVPEWLRGRHAEVIARLWEHSGHVVEETDEGFDTPLWELAPVASEAHARAIAQRDVDTFFALEALEDAPASADARGWVFRARRASDGGTTLVRVDRRTGETAYDRPDPRT